MIKRPGSLHLLLLAAVLTLTAGPAFAQAGPGPGGGAGAVTLTNFNTADFSGSGVCAVCHSRLTDRGGNDVSMDAHWRSTMMANASKDPLWQAKISSEVSRIPALKTVIEEKCSRCHMGMARYQALTDGSPVAVFGADGFLDPAHPLHEAAMDGVSCTLCHQIQNVNLGQPGSFTGNYAIDTSTSPPGRLIFGPFAQPPRNPMANNSGFTPQQGQHMTSATHCAVCHTLYTPSVDLEGNVLPDEFPEQMTYPEWKLSSFSQDGPDFKSCQDCHMPEALGPVVISNRPLWLPARSPFGQHHFVGGNSYMITLLSSHAAELGVTAEPEHLETTTARTDAQLQSNTAALDITSITRNNGEITFTVHVQNQAGHKLPTGIPTRRVWLHATVEKAGGGVVFESGRPETDGRIAGDDAVEGPLPYEPHYEIISRADQVQIYEPVMLDSAGNVTYTLLRAVSYGKDNRLLPSGFDKTAAASTDMAVYGRASTDADFTSGGDQVSYRISDPGGALTLRAELLFQAVAYPFAEDLRPDDTDAVTRFMTHYDASDKTPKTIAVAEATVQ